MSYGTILRTIDACKGMDLSDPEDRVRLAQLIWRALVTDALGDALDEARAARKGRAA